MKRIYNKHFSILCLLVMIINILLLSGCAQETMERYVRAVQDDEIELNDEIDASIREFLGFDDSEASKDVTAEKEVTDEGSYVFSEGQLEIHFIDVGQADSTLILCDGDSMLIDGGDENAGTLVQNYIFKQGIGKLNYVIGTHPDSDHYGGLDVIITKFDCENILLPDYKKDTKACESVYDAVFYKNYNVTNPVTGDVFNLGGAKITILAPIHYDYGEESNNYSICILIEYGSKRFLFTGDAEKEVETDLVNSNYLIKADVYKVGHHGSGSSTTDDFLSAVDPEYAVISCGEGNEYGHPHAAVLNRLRKDNVKVFRTDEQGSIICYCDGESISWNCSPSTSWTSGN